MNTAIYVRVSSKSQDLRSQETDLKRWADSQEGVVRYYRDKASGKDLDRPEWNKLWAAVERGEINRVVVWRLDRLGRTASGLTRLYEDLIERKVTLISLRDSFDLFTASGRLMANMLASVAAYEREVRRERQQAGIEAAKAAGVKWGGRKAGTRVRLTPDKERTIKQLHRAGETIAAISRSVGLSRPTIYGVIAPA